MTKEDWIPNLSQSQSQSYFTTGGLPPISLSWRQAPWDPRPEFLFSNWTLGGYSPYVTTFLMRGWVCRLMANRIESSLILWPTVRRPFHLGIKHPSGAYDQIFITVRQLRVCWCGALSLTRRRVCRYNCCWSSSAQAFSGPSPVGLATILYCLRFETSLFVASAIRRTAMEVFDPASTRDKFRINYVSPLYNFGEDRICHHHQQFLCYSMFIRCCGNVC
jgi:hypothetical protein